ncbi:hypothetical protein M878_08905 [Streptomyces roseochromogenus subsp. oscitans DS 12.976]|uniref:Uncharacterized protein n=1 Tax=Streptomyces roseochromogenus subsp. oscitans DS 12.976 TaxID=1352936 RepID=V6KTR2_STRRC|nr:hypothetical protein M878_08905 [Streptomyces roseochromogenus subsp. oscitans DS 12.976]
MAGLRLWGPRCAVAVAGEDEQVGSFGRSDDLPLDTTGPLQAGAGASEASFGGHEELPG